MTGAHRSRYPRYHSLPWWDGLCYRGVHRGVYDWNIGSHLNFSIEIRPEITGFDMDYLRDQMARWRE